MSNLVQNPYEIYTDANGDPLEDGYILIGEPGLSPITNPLQAYWDAALSIPANDIRTKGGYAHNSGTPGRLYTATNYSILVKDKLGSAIYTQLNSIDYLEAPLTEAILKVDTIADLRLVIPVDENTQVSVGGSVTVGDGLVPQLYYWDPNSAAVDNGVTIVQPTEATGFGRWLIINNATIPTETVDLTFADTGSTLTLGFLNQIYLVDTDGGATALIVPDGDFDGQEITLSNTGSNTLEINGTGIITDTSIVENATLFWIGTEWSITNRGITALENLTITNDLTVGNEILVDTIVEKTTNAGVSFPNTMKWKYYEEAIALTQDAVFDVLDPLIPNVGDYMAVYGVGNLNTQEASIVGIARTITTQIRIAFVDPTDGTSGSSPITDGTVAGSYTFKIMSNFDKM